MVRQAKWLMAIVAIVGMVAVAGCNKNDDAIGEPMLGAGPGETISYDESADAGAGLGVSTPGSGADYTPSGAGGSGPQQPTGGYDSAVSVPTTPPTVTTPTQPRPGTYTVQKGDTLYSIARTMYGDQTRWKDIYEANRNQLPDPHTLKVGQTLRLP